LGKYLLAISFTGDSKSSELMEGGREGGKGREGNVNRRKPRHEQTDEGGREGGK